MGSINLQSLQEQSVKEYTYKDISLDVKQNSMLSNFGLFRQTNSNDIEESRDEAAIRNSINNILTTSPGEKLLNPVFGCDLRRYLFAPMTSNTAENIGQSIRNAINTWEPRVTLIKVSVGMNKSQHQYTITLILRIPALNNKKTVLTGSLTSNGYNLT